MGCFFFLFEQFVDLTSFDHTDLPGGNSTLAPAVEVPSGAALTTMLAALTCVALGAGAILLLLRWLKDRPGTPRWVMVLGGIPSVVMVGLGIYLMVSGTLHGSLPYGGVPDVNTQVDVGGMEPLQLTVLVTLVLLVILVGVTKPRLLVLLMVILLVSALLFGLLSSSGFRGLNPYGYSGQMGPVAGGAQAVGSLLQRGPASDIRSGLSSTGAGQQVGAPGNGDFQTGEATASTDGNPLPTTPPVQDTTTGETGPVLMEVKADPIAPVGVPYRLTGTLTGADDRPLSSVPVTIEVDGQPQAILNTDARGGFAWETVFSEASESTVDVGFPGNAEYGPVQTELPVTVATPEFVVEPPDPVARGDTLMLEGNVSVGGQPVPNTPVTVDGQQLGRTDANGNFALPFMVPFGTPLGSMPLGLGLPALDGSSTAFASIMSATSLLLKPLERMRPGQAVPVEATLLDDQGVGVPDATIDCGDGVTAVTGPDGVANLVLPPLEGEELSQSLENCGFDGDDSNLAAEASVSTDNGFNWWLWIGLPLAVVAGSVVGYLLVRRFRAVAALLRRAGRLVVSLLGGLAIWRRGGSRAREDDDHSPVVTTEHLQVIASTATHFEITLIKLAEDLPFIWGVGEQVQVEIRLTDDSGEGVAGQTVTAVIDELGNPVELMTDAEGRCHTSWTVAEPGTYRVVADFAGVDQFPSASAHHEFEVVHFRDDIVGRYNSFLPWVREREPRITEQTTPREMEVMVVDSGMPVDHRAMEVVIARFEEADYSLHEIDRPRFEAMYRARRKVVGD